MPFVGTDNSNLINNRRYVIGMHGLHRLLRSRDFCQNPAKAVWRRLVWRARWQVMRQPWLLSLSEDLKIAVPKSGSGALMYYQDFSEPDTADFLLRFLKPGMVFLDVGAHVGEYTLLAAQAVGPTGEVHAFEPNPEIFQLLSNNVQLNNLSNVVCNSCAVSDLAEEREFEVCKEPSVSSLKTQAGHGRKDKILESIRVPSIRLNTYWFRYNKRIDLVKIDVEGAEMLVFLGAEKLLNLPEGQAPIWIFEYGLDNYTAFGYRPADLFGLLQGYDYGIWYYTTDQLLPVSPDTIPPGTVNLIAAKAQTSFRSILETE